MVTLEREFEEYKALHKYAVLKAKVMDYYNTLEQSQVNLPNFMRDDNAEKLADRELRRLVLLDDNLATFNRLYERAWEEIAEVMP